MMSGEKHLLKLRAAAKTLLAVILCFIATACEKPAEKEARYIRHGNELFEQGNYAKARVEYKNAAQIMPTDAEPRYRLGLVDEAEGDIRNAFGNYMTAEQQNPHYRPALLKIAQYLLAAEQYEQSEKRIDVALADAPDDADAHAVHAALLLREKNYPETEKEARFALGKDPANVNAVSVLAGLYYAQKNYAKAEEVLDTGIAHNPENLSLLLLQARMYEESSDLSNVAKVYSVIFKLKPKDADQHAALAMIYLKGGKTDEAEAALRAGIAAVPEDWGIKKKIVIFMDRQRGLDAAEKEINSLIKAYPHHDDLYFWLADLYTTHNAIDRAEALLNKIVASEQLDNVGLNARNSLARLQFIKGNRALAEKLVATVLEKDSGNQDALLIHAQMSFDAGHYQQAVSDLRSILRDNPRMKGALQLLAETLLLQGHLDLAIDTMNQLVDIDPTNYAARVRLSQMYSISGDSAQALKLLGIVTKLAPDYSIGWESLVRIAINIKDWNKAEAANHVLDMLKGQHLVAIFLRGQILQHQGKPADAIPLYIQVFSADPSSPLADHAFSAFVETEQSLNQLQNATDTLSAIKTNNPLVATLLGKCFVHLNKPQEAAISFDKAIAENSPSQDPYIGRFQLYVQDNKVDLALNVLKKAWDIAPSDIRAPMLSAGLYGKLGRYKEAIALYEEILARNPDLDIAANNLAQMIADYQYEDPAALDKARQMAERFTNSDQPLYLDTIGWIYYRQGNIQQAQVIMERMMKSNATLPPELHYHYARLLLKTGNTEKAKTELTLATVKDASYPEVEQARKLLAN